MLDSYRDQTVIIRSREPAELAECASEVGPEQLVNVQLLSLNGDPRILIDMPEPVPVDLVLEDIAGEFPLLYQYADLLPNRPARVSILASPGVSRASKLALSLGFEVKLILTQPDRALVHELVELLEHYLHNPTVAAPIEFYQSLLISFIEDSPVTLWTIQEEDPSFDRYVTDKERVVLSRRLKFVELPDNDSTFLNDLQRELFQRTEECNSCGFSVNCAGYFKLPDPNYNCAEIRGLLQILKDASVELMEDLKQSVRILENRTNGDN